MPCRYTHRFTSSRIIPELGFPASYSNGPISKLAIVVNLIFIVSMNPTTFAFVFEDRVEVTGDATYTYGDNESLLAATTTAKTLAIRKAIESYQVFVDATSTVQDFQLTQDLVKTIAAGYLHDLKIVEQSETGRTIHVRVKGYVLPKEIKSVLNQKLASSHNNIKKTAKGGDLDCTNFSSQATAQAELRKNPADPHRLDRNRDGIACKSNPPPRDLRPVTR